MSYSCERNFSNLYEHLDLDILTRLGCYDVVIINNVIDSLTDHGLLFLELLSQLKMNRILDKLLQVSTDTVDSPVPGGDSLLYPDVSPLPSDRQRPD